MCARSRLVFHSVRVRNIFYNSREFVVALCAVRVYSRIMKEEQRNDFVHGMLERCLSWLKKTHNDVYEGEYFSCTH